LRIVLVGLGISDAGWEQVSKSTRRLKPVPRFEPQLCLQWLYLCRIFLVRLIGFTTLIQLTVNAGKYVLLVNSPIYHSLILRMIGYGFLRWIFIFFNLR
jgi:hypothetical protein